MLYLVRHGEAQSPMVDPERGLTPDGVRLVELTAAWAARADLGIHQIRHSGKRRAEQTAQILAEHLKPSAGVMAVSGLSPNDDVRRTAELVSAENTPLMLVGHLPFMSRLVSELLCGNPDQLIYEFDTGAIACLRREAHRWFLGWLLQPYLLE